MINLSPIHDNLVVELLDVEEQQTDAIILTPVKKSGLQKAKVLAAGNGYPTANGSFQDLTIQVGDTVILDPNFKYEKVSFQGKNLVFIKERNILAKITG